MQILGGRVTHFTELWLGGRCNNKENQISAEGGRRDLTGCLVSRQLQAVWPDIWCSVCSLDQFPLHPCIGLMWSFDGFGSYANQGPQHAVCWGPGGLLQCIQALVPPPNGPMLTKNHSCLFTNREMPVILVIITIELIVYYVNQWNMSTKESCFYGNFECFRNPW